MYRDHVDVDEALDEPLYVFVGLLVSYSVDDLVGMDRPRLLARRSLLWVLEHGSMPTDDELAADAAAGAPEPDPDTWGLDAQAEADQQRALAQFGGGL